MKTKRIEWRKEKNAALKQSRDVCFEAVENALRSYVPFVEDENSYFLKSIIPSRREAMENQPLVSVRLLENDLQRIKTEAIKEGSLRWLGFRDILFIMSKNVVE